MVIQGTVLGSYRQGGTGGGQSGNWSVTGAGHFVVLIPHLARCEVCRITFRITGPGVDVNERSEPARLFRLRFIRLLSFGVHLNPRGPDFEFAFVGLEQELLPEALSLIGTCIEHIDIANQNLVEF